MTSSSSSSSLVRTMFLAQERQRTQIGHCNRQQQLDKCSQLLIEAYLTGMPNIQIGPLTLLSAFLDHTDLGSRLTLCIQQGQAPIKVFLIGDAEVLKQSRVAERHSAMWSALQLIIKFIPDTEQSPHMTLEKRWYYYIQQWKRLHPAYRAFAQKYYWRELHILFKLPKAVISVQQMYACFNKRLVQAETMFHATMMKYEAEHKLAEQNINFAVTMRQVFEAARTSFHLAKRSPPVCPIKSNTTQYGAEKQEELFPVGYRTDNYRQSEYFEEQHCIRTQTFDVETADIIAERQRVQEAAQEKQRQRELQLKQERFQAMKQTRKLQQNKSMNNIVFKCK